MGSLKHSLLALGFPLRHLLHRARRVALVAAAAAEDLSMVSATTATAPPRRRLGAVGARAWPPGRGRAGALPCIGATRSGFSPPCWIPLARARNAGPRLRGADPPMATPTQGGGLSHAILGIADPRRASDRHADRPAGRHLPRRVRAGSALGQRGALRVRRAVVGPVHPHRPVRLPARGAADGRLLRLGRRVCARDHRAARGGPHHGGHAPAHPQHLARGGDRARGAEVEDDRPGLLPGGLPGIVTGILLAVARIAGETAPLLLRSFGNTRFTSISAGPWRACPCHLPAGHFGLPGPDRHRLVGRRW